MTAITDADSVGVHCNAKGLSTAGTGRKSQYRLLKLSQCRLLKPLVHALDHTLVSFAYFQTIISFAHLSEATSLLKANN